MVCAFFKQILQQKIWDKKQQKTNKQQEKTRKNKMSKLISRRRDFLEFSPVTTAAISGWNSNAEHRIPACACV